MLIVVFELILLFNEHFPSFFPVRLRKNGYEYYIVGTVMKKFSLIMSYSVRFCFHVVVMQKIDYYMSEVF